MSAPNCIYSGPVDDRVIFVIDQMATGFSKLNSIMSRPGNITHNDPQVIETMEWEHATETIGSVLAANCKFTVLCERCPRTRSPWLMTDSKGQVFPTPRTLHMLVCKTSIDVFSTSIYGSGCHAPSTSLCVTIERTGSPPERFQYTMSAYGTSP